MYAMVKASKLVSKKEKKQQRRSKAHRQQQQQQQQQQAGSARSSMASGEKKRKHNVFTPTVEPVQTKIRDNQTKQPKKKKIRKVDLEVVAPPSSSEEEDEDDDEEDEDDEDVVFDPTEYVRKMKFSHLQYLAASVGKSLPFGNGRGAAPKARAHVVKLFASKHAPEALTYAELVFATSVKAKGNGDGDGDSGDGDKDFMKAKSFQGSQPGYVFKQGPKGQGYYIDSQGTGGGAAEEEEGEEVEEMNEEEEEFNPFEDEEKKEKEKEVEEKEEELQDTGEGTVVKKQHRVNGSRGVSWVDLIIGNGPQKPIKGRFALIRYVARLNDADGPVFDSSEESQQSQPVYQNTVKKKPAKPARLKLGSGKHRNNPPWAFKYGKDQVIVGLEIGMKSMWEGGRRIIHIPWTVGYGRVGTRKVPGETNMSFEVELVGVGS